MPSCPAYYYDRKWNMVVATTLTTETGAPKVNHSKFLKYIDNFAMGVFRMYVLLDLVDGRYYYVDSMYIRPQE